MSCAARLFDPPAQQPADLRNHLAHVLVLPSRKPLPLVRQAQVEPQLVQVRVRVQQVSQSLAAAVRVRQEDRLLEVQRRIL